MLVDQFGYQLFTSTGLTADENVAVRCSGLHEIGFDLLDREAIADNGLISAMNRDIR